MKKAREEAEALRLANMPQIVPGLRGNYRNSQHDLDLEAARIMQEKEYREHEL